MFANGAIGMYPRNLANDWKMRSPNDQHQNAHAAQLSNIIMIMYFFRPLSHFPFLTSDLRLHHVRAPTAGCSATLKFAMFGGGDLLQYCSTTPYNKWKGNLIKPSLASRRTSWYERSRIWRSPPGVSGTIWS